MTAVSPLLLAIISMLVAILMLVLRVLWELMSFRGKAETLLDRHSKELDILTVQLSNLDCQRTGRCGAMPRVMTP